MELPDVVHECAGCPLVAVFGRDCLDLRDSSSRFELQSPVARHSFQIELELASAVGAGAVVEKDEWDVANADGPHSLPYERLLQPVGHEHGIKDERARVVLGLAVWHRHERLVPRGVNQQTIFWIVRLPTAAPARQRSYRPMCKYHRSHLFSLSGM